MTFEFISEGFLAQCQPNTAAAVAAGSRCAVLAGGEVVCTFVVQSKLGVNDFVPMIARSRDGGATWSEPQPIWAHLARAFSIFGSVSPAAGEAAAGDGQLLYFGARYPIDQPGESFWQESNQGLKQNELIWATSSDSGRRWTDPRPFPMPIPGSAEAPGPMCATRRGRWICCYAPYNTFDTNVLVDRSQIVAMRSDDRGRTWKHNSMIRFPDPSSSGAEAWVIELSDGRLLGTCWHINPNGEQPNAYALSLDHGESWLPTRSTGILGQSTALAALPAGRALFAYNQRKHGPIGVWLAVVRPTETDFGVESNDVIWRAQASTGTQSGTAAGHDQWQDFSFGEPSINVLPDDTLLVTLWCIEPAVRGVRFVKLRMK